MMEKSISWTDFKDDKSHSELRKKRNKSFGTLLTLDDLSNLPFDRFSGLKTDSCEGGESVASLDSYNLLGQFEYRLGHEVEETLKRAAEKEDQERSSLLEDLYHNICGRIEDSVRLKLADPDPPSAIPEYYYQLLSSYFGEHMAGSALVRSLQSSWMSLWSHQIFPAIFVLLFGDWLFRNLPESVEALSAHMSTYISGVNRVLWNDVQSNRRAFDTVYVQLRRAVSRRDIQRVLPVRLRIDLQNLVFRFYFYYDQPSEVRRFLMDLPDVMDPIRFGLVQNENVVEETGDQVPLARATNELVHEVTSALRNIRRESSLLRYLESVRALAGLPLSQVAASRLQTALYRFVTPGGPVYPSRAVRHMAKQVMDEMFPVGFPSLLLSSFLFSSHLRCL